MIDGVSYPIIADGIASVVKTRGLVKKQRKQAMAEDFVTVTTTPRPR